jgi:hypothetical protein
MVGTYYFTRFLENVDVQIFFYDSILAYGNAIRSLQSCSRRMYSSHPLVSNIVDTSTYSIKFLCSYLTDTRMEPMTNKWISSIAIDKQNMMTELYEYDIGYVVETFKNQLSALRVVLGECTNYVEGMVVLRNHDQYLCRLTSSESTLSNVILPSSVRFLSIEYRHPDMSTGIYIDLPTGMYSVDNEILSDLFVKRCLEYQSYPYIFDTRYTLHLIDQDIAELELSSGQFIRIHDDTYSVLST